MQLPSHTRAIALAARPHGLPAPGDFALVDAPLPALRAGQALVRNVVMSVDPYMRGRMDDRPSYVPPFRLHEPLEGGAVGEVIASANPAMPLGAFVLHAFGWREFAIVDAGTIVDTTAASPSAYLGVLGMPGLTAFVGLVEIAKIAAGETVFISAASGAVGSIAAGIAKLLGATTIGSTGSEANVPFLLDELRYDRAFVARTGAVSQALQDAAPDGIDVYFDNVGGETLDAALVALRPFGRIAACGMISGYNERVDGPKNLAMIVGKRLRMEGFIVSDHFKRFPEFLALAGPAVRDGRIVAPETIVDGLEGAPAAFISLFERGAKRGKLVVRLQK